MKRLALFVTLALGLAAAPAHAAVSANAEIVGSGTDWALLLHNTGDQTINCMRFTAAPGVTITRINGPGTTAFTPTGFTAQSMAIAPGGNPAYQFGTVDPYPTNGGGTLFVSDTCATGSDVAAPVTGPPPPAAAGPQPVLGQTEVVSVVSGTVRVRLKGQKTFTTLTTPKAIPDGSEIDTKTGKLHLVVAVPGGTEEADISEGRTVIHQVTGRSPPVTDLTLSEPLTGCPSPARAAARKKKKGPTSRRIVISTKGGHFESVGRYATAIATGTAWRTTDTCTATVVQAIEGTVRVTDLRRKASAPLRAPGRRKIARRP